MLSQYHCQNQLRRQIARTQPGVDGQYVNGIDYLEVASDQNTVIVHLLHELQSNDRFTADNIQITTATGQSVAIDSASATGKRFSLRLKPDGDRASSYFLRLVASPLQRLQLGQLNSIEPPTGFDPQLSEIQFSLRSPGNSDIDCKPQAPPLDAIVPPPEIDYLAKDYASFRQLMLDRLTITLPKWKERNPSDIGVMLVEILAYAADHLSYHQDAVATEAYLGTARKRVSVRRHARLLDYFVHDGCNARAWVALEVEKPQADPQRFNPRTDGIHLLGASPRDRRAGTRFFSQINGLPPVLHPHDNQEQIRQALNSDAQVFETLENITLYQACNNIHIYTWGEPDCYLPVGTTQATLKDSGGKLQHCLTQGKVLIFEEIRNPNTGKGQGIDLTHRHAVRLKNVQPKTDLLLADANDPTQCQSLVEVEWYAEDALPFDLWISKRIEGRVYSDIGVVRGNVVLVDHGRTYPDAVIDKDLIEPAKAQANQNPTLLDASKLNRVMPLDRYRPRLKYSPLTQQSYVLSQQGGWVLVDPEKAARAVLKWQNRETRSRLAQKEYKAQEATREELDQKRRFVRPSITLKEYNAQEFSWNYQRDLLNSERFSRDFVVETEDDGQAYLRFGDGVLGKQPEVGTYFEVTYRVGNGSAGNVGAEAIAHIVSEQQGILAVRNPIPAQGGIDPEPIEQVKLYAPQAFRVPQRAVTTKDYEEVAQRFPEVQRVRATQRWTGSWYTIFLAVDREGGKPLDESFTQNLRSFLEPFRMAGQDLAIEEPRFVPLDIAIAVQVDPGYFQTAVKQALVDVFSNRVLPNGQVGFFYPDQLTFGQSIFLSQVIQTAVQVEGVRSVEVTRFQRWGRRAQAELKTGEMTFGALEIPRLNNDPGNPHQGRIEFNLEGGL
ncbi:putative baseplate assembly protein [Leptolyngbya sp. DQ-M1]|uniref:putative baseplate assembly protein n=1 Tax=Leptolyngbya sp. DQ-M1 TaxID=2933920 RepID=UPI003297F23E